MPKRLIPVRCFTRNLPFLANTLISPVSISIPYHPSLNPGMKPPEHRHFKAIWDTGATGSVITKKVVKECGLKATGMMRVFTPSGDGLMPTYLVNIILPNRVIMARVKVVLGKLQKGNVDIDVLIGMDVISQGDFAVTNKGLKTTFSFRFPSLERIDFTKHQQKNTDSQ